MKNWWTLPPRGPFARLCFSLGFGLALVLAVASAAPAAEDRSGIKEMGVSLGGAFSSREGVEVYPIFARAGGYFPESIDRPLRNSNLQLKWLIEPWVAGVRARDDAIEFGVNPLFFKLDYDWGQRVVPFVYLAEGVMYTSVQGIGLAGPFEFSNAAGLGAHFFLDSETALSFWIRFRHISNAGIKDPNRGLDSFFFLIGLDRFPGRE